MSQPPPSPPPQSPPPASPRPDPSPRRDLTRHHHLTRRRLHHSPPAPSPPPYRCRPHHHLQSLAAAALVIAAIAIAAHTTATFAAAASVAAATTTRAHKAGATRVTSHDLGTSAGRYRTPQGCAARACAVRGCAARGCAARARAGLRRARARVPRRVPRGAVPRAPVPRGAVPGVICHSDFGLCVGCAKLPSKGTIKRYKAKIFFAGLRPAPSWGLLAPRPPELRASAGYHPSKGRVTAVGRSGDQTCPLEKKRDVGLLALMRK